MMMILRSIQNKAEQYGLNVRFVEESDAKDILYLRTQTKASQYLSPTKNNLAKQVEYLRRYKQREINKEEFYFTFLSLDNQTLGFYRVYNLDKVNKTFTIGSWVFFPDVLDYAPVIADILVKDFGFSELDFNTCLFDVRKTNLKVIKYHQMYNPDFLHGDEENVFFSLSKKAFYENSVDVLDMLNLHES